MFTHQYSHAWIDFCNRQESWRPHIDCFENSIAATRAHQAFCQSLSHEFPGYSTTIGGITASHSIKGYVVWGGPPCDLNIDGTVVPSAAGGSLMFTPDISLPALRHAPAIRPHVYGPYGFVDSFNPNTGWVDSDVIGIKKNIPIIPCDNAAQALSYARVIRSLIRFGRPVFHLGFHDGSPNPLCS